MTLLSIEAERMDISLDTLDASGYCLTIILLGLVFQFAIAR